MYSSARPVLHRHIELHRFTLTMNLQRHLVAGISTRGQEIGKVKLLIKRINVVTILIEIEVANGRDEYRPLAGRLSQPRVARLNPVT